MKKFRKMKNQKGFTLVEVIVVLVILAIMAAILIPSLVGYIDKARENSIVEETRSVVQAVQTIASEKYIKNKDNGNYTIGDTASDKVISYTEIEKLCEIEAATLKNNIKTDSKIEGGKITVFKYESGGKTCEYPGYKVS